MAYQKTNWQDTLRDAQGNVIQKGTPLNAQVLGKIEDGIVAAEQKIDNEISQVTTQLAQNVVKANNVSAYIKFGDLKYPKKYEAYIKSKIPFKLFRDFDGIIKHNFDIEDYKTDNKVYWKSSDAVNPLSNDANNGLTPETPVANWARVEEVINSLPSNDVSIVLMDKFISVDRISPSSVVLSKNLTLESYYEMGTHVGTSSSYFDWVEDGGLLKTNRTVAYKVIDYEKRDFKGVPTELMKVSTKEECQSTKNSWYTDGTSVWINSNKSVGRRYDIGIIVRKNVNKKFVINGKRLILKNLHFGGTPLASAKMNGLEVEGDSESNLIIWKCSFKYATNNGLAIKNVGVSYLFNPISSENLVDGLNYHGVGTEFVFEYNAYASDNGTELEGSANATTAHDGMTILRVGTIGERCFGALLADVNDCVSINYDCRMYDNLVVKEGIIPGAFYFQGGGDSTGAEQWLINCEGGGNNTYTLLSTSKKAFVVGLKGTAIHPASKVEYVDFV